MKGLLIDPPDTLQGTDIKRVLGSAIAGALALKLAIRLLVGLGLVERGDLCLGQQDAVLRHLGFELHRGQIVTLPHAPHARRRDRQPAPLQRLRTWPQAGCSIASATTACSISTGVRFFRIGLRRLISCNASSPPLSYSSLKR